MSGAAGACNGNKWKYASTNFCSTDPLVNAERATSSSASPA